VQRQEKSKGRSSFK